MPMNLGLGLGLTNRAASGSGAPPALILDSLTAGAAYSTRKLRTAYTGAAIRVRRSSDNTEQDIGFSGNALDTAALASFVGANSGFVTTWYDQSGNARHVTQTTQANQPRIVNAGTIETVNSLPSIFFNGTSHILFNSSPFMWSAGAVTAQIVMSCGAQADRAIVAEGSSSTNTQLYRLGVQAGGNNLGFFIRTDANVESVNNSSLTAIQGALTSTLRCIGWREGSSTLEGFNNGTAATSSTYTRGTLTLNRFAVGGAQRTGAGQFFSGSLSEIIIADTTRSNADFNAIQADQGGAYGITVNPI